MPSVLPVEKVKTAARGRRSSTEYLKLYLELVSKGIKTPFRLNLSEPQPHVGNERGRGTHAFSNVVDVDKD